MKINKTTLRVIGLTMSIIGGAVSMMNELIEQKRMEKEIEEKVNEALDEREKAKEA